MVKNKTPRLFSLAYCSRRGAACGNYKHPSNNRNDAEPKLSGSRPATFEIKPWLSVRISARRVVRNKHKLCDVRERESCRQRELRG